MRLGVRQHTQEAAMPLSASTNVNRSWIERVFSKLKHLLPTTSECAAQPHGKGSAPPLCLTL
jgi:hypothetical protein